MSTSLRKEESVHINNLPSEILLEIFSYLNFIDLCHCSQVCRNWNTMTKDFSLKRVIKLNHIKVLPNQLIQIMHFHCSPVLEDFQLCRPRNSKALHNLPKKPLRELFKKYTKLRKLTLSGCILDLVSTEDIPPYLQHLSIRASQVSPSNLFGVSCGEHVSHLTCLDIGEITFLTSQDLLVLSGLTSLRSLYMDGCMRVNNGGIEAISDILPQLHTLDIERTDVSNDGVKTIFECGAKLKELFIGHLPVDDRIFKHEVINRTPLLSVLCVQNTNVSARSLISFLSNRVSKLKLTVAFSHFRVILPGCEIKKVNSDNISDCMHVLSHKC